MAPYEPKHGRVPGVHRRRKESAVRVRVAVDELRGWRSPDEIAGKDLSLRFQRLLPFRIAHLARKKARFARNRKAANPQRTAARTPRVSAPLDPPSRGLDGGEPLASTGAAHTSSRGAAHPSARRRREKRALGLQPAERPPQQARSSTGVQGYAVSLRVRIQKRRRFLYLYSASCSRLNRDWRQSSHDTGIWTTRPPDRWVR